MFKQRLAGYFLLLALYACGGSNSTDGGVGTTTTGTATTGTTTTGTTTTGTGTAGTTTMGTGTAGTTTTGTTTTGTGTTTGNPTLFEQRTTQLQAASDKISSLTFQAPGVFEQQMLDWFRSRGEYVASGIQTDGSVWARFADNATVVIPPIQIIDGMDENAPLPDGPPDEVLPKMVEGGAKFSVLAFGVRNDASNFVSARLGGAGYSGFKSQLSVNNLRTLASGDIGVLHLECHGGAFLLPDSSEEFAIVTSTDRGQPAELALGADLADGSVVYNLAVHFTVDVAHHLPQVVDALAGRPFRPALKYGVSSRFIKKHVRLKAGSLVFVNGCGGYGSQASPMVQAFTTAPVNAGGAYVSWSNKVNDDDAAETAKFLYDRVLGENSDVQTFMPESPLQRPFGLRAVLSHMSGRTRGRSLPGGANSLTSSRLYVGPIPTDAQLRSSGAIELVPSLREIGIAAEGDQPKLRLQGDFGDEDITDGKVLFNGNEMTLTKPWNPLELECALPSGSHAGGSVQVQIGKHKSNKVMLTEYRAHIRVEQDAAIRRVRTGQYIEDSTYHASANVDVTFRAQAQDFRRNPGDKPETPIVVTPATSNSRLASYSINSFTEAYYNFAPQLKYFIRQGARRSGPFNAASLSDVPGGFFGVTNLDRNTKQFIVTMGVPDGVLNEVWQTDDPEHRFTNERFFVSVASPVPLKFFQKGSSIQFADGTTSKTVTVPLAANETGHNRGTITLMGVDIVSGAPDETGGI